MQDGKKMSIILQIIILYLDVSGFVPEALLEVPAQDEYVPVLGVEHHLVTRSETQLLDIPAILIRIVTLDLGLGPPSASVSAEMSLHRFVATS